MHARIFSVHLLKTIAFLYILYIPDVKGKIREAEVDCDDTTGYLLLQFNLCQYVGLFAQSLRFITELYF